LNRYIETVIYIFTLLGIAIFIYIKRGEFSVFLQINPTYLLLLLIIHFIPVYILAYIFKINISIFNLRLNFKEWFGITVSNTMYNYILPFRGGMALKGLYLKRQYAFPYSKYLAYLSGFLLINFILSAFLAVLTGTIIRFFSGLKEINQTLYFLVIIFFIILVFVAYFLQYKNLTKVTFRKYKKILKYINNILSGLHYFKTNPKQVKLLFVLQGFFIIAMGVRLFFAYTFLGIEVSIIKLIFIQSVVTFTRLIAITPGNIGIKEGIIGLSSSLLGISPEEALLGAVLDRVVAMIVVFALGAVFSRILLKEVNLNKEQ
jgi:uncharacterized protein (TIRG00374 family)